MEKFRTIKDALKKGYKIYCIDYMIEYQEFSIYLRNENNGKLVHFYNKSLPSYLTHENFEKIDLITENWAYFKMELSIPKFS